MSLEENKAIVNRSTAVLWNKGNMAVIDELYAIDFIMHDPSQGDGDLEYFKQYARGVLTGIPDLHIATDDLIAEGDQVVKRWTARGTHKGDFMGIPATGNQIEVAGIEIYRIADGKIVEIWGVMDSLGLMQQLGVIPPMGGGGE